MTMVLKKKAIEDIEHISKVIKAKRRGSLFLYFTSNKIGGTGRKEGSCSHFLKLQSGLLLCIFSYTLLPKRDRNSFGNFYLLL